MEDLEEELDGGLLLELEALADGAGGVEHDADAQGQVGLLGEADDGVGRLAVVEQAEVLLLEAGDEVAVLVGDGEDEVDFVDADDDGTVMGSGRVGPVCGRCCRSCGAGVLGCGRGGCGAAGAAERARSAAVLRARAAIAVGGEVGAAQ